MRVAILNNVNVNWFCNLNFQKAFKQLNAEFAKATEFARHYDMLIDNKE